MTAPVSRVLASHALASVAMSLPWPMLLVLVWQQTGSETWLGVAAASRMAPYVALSWWVARLADRRRRDRLVRVTLVARVALLLAASLAIASGAVAAAVVLCTLAVAVATPAYPALAAGMPRLAGAGSQRATDLLVTIEVASFVVGPALGGLMLGVPWLVGPASVVAAVAAWALYLGIRQPRPEQLGVSVAPPAGSLTPTTNAAAVGDARRTRLALSVLVLANLVVAATGIALIPLAEQTWDLHPWGWDDATVFGVATGALGFGALGGPLLRRRVDLLGTRLRRGMALAALGLLLVTVAPTMLLACAPLLLVGASAVGVEAAATELLQRAVPDERRAGVLGVGDSVMVLAALVGALVAPTLAAWWGPRALLAALASLCLVALGLVTRALRLEHPGRVVAARPAVEVNTLAE